MRYKDEILFVSTQLVLVNPQKKTCSAYTFGGIPSKEFVPSMSIRKGADRCICVGVVQCRSIVSEQL